ncbi:hypothetical protein [Bacillus wiedmannii]|nr:hypothetical protein [Bacillus wiedmannii]
MLAKPLVDLLREQYHPHCQIIIDNDRVRIVEDVVGVVPMLLNGEKVARSVIRGTQV